MKNLESPFPTRNVVLMMVLGVGALGGQGMSLWSLVGFHEQKTEWDLRQLAREELQTELASLRELAAAARGNRADAEALRDQARTELSAANADLDAARKRLAEAKVERQQAEQQTLSIEAEAEAARLASSKLATEIKDSESKVESLKSERQDLSGQIGKLRSDLDRLKIEGADAAGLRKVFSGRLKRFEVGMTHAEALDPRNPVFASYLLRCVGLIHGAAGEPAPFTAASAR